MPVNEDSVLPVLLADLLPAHTPNRQGTDGGQRPGQVLPSGSQRCPDHCARAAPHTPPTSPPEADLILPEASLTLEELKTQLGPGNFFP